MPNADRHIVFVTGASSGFGAAIARRFAREGARVVLAARREDRLHALASELGPRAHPLPLDVRDRAAVERAIAALPPAFAEVSVLVNNAGGAHGLEPAHEANLDDWETMIDTNIKGLLYATRAILPGMVARDRGHVVNIGSVAVPSGCRPLLCSAPPPSTSRAGPTTRSFTASTASTSAPSSVTPSAPTHAVESEQIALVAAEVRPRLPTERRTGASAAPTGHAQAGRPVALSRSDG